MENKKPYGTVLIKAAKIIDCIAEEENITLQEIAARCEMTTSTTLKILDTLVIVGYVNKTLDKNYKLGSKLIRYANKHIDQIDLIESTLPYLEDLRDQVDETIHLGILNNDEIYYINKLEPINQAIRMSSKVGISRPLYSSAMGKAALAYFDEAYFNQYLERHELKPFTANTITNPLKLAKELVEIKKTHIAFDDEEMEEDIYCIGTTIIRNQQLVGAFSISVPKYRLNDHYKTELIEKIKTTKTLIEKS